MTGPGGRGRVAAAVATVAAVLALALRFAATGPLWLDEALSVNIARLPLRDLPGALRHDGSPPLYYLLLHGWLRAFGTGPVAVRALSAVVAVATVPAAWWFAREVSRSRRVAWVAALLVATSPFAARYGSEARMYALVQLLVALGGTALVRLYRRPSALSFAAVAACSGLLALTHYWALFLLAAVAGLLALLRAWRGVLAVAAGAVLFAPWLPAFAFQLRHTGTPWAPRPQLASIVEALLEWSGPGTGGRFLAVLLLLLAFLAVLGAGVDARRVELDLRGRPLGRRLGAVVLATLALGIVSGLLLGSGYAARYTSVVLVPFLVLAAAGTETLLDERVRTGVVAVAAMLGLVAAVPYVLTPRTQAGAVAAALRARAVPGDVVVYCPDQLGPAVSRLAPPGLVQRVYPTGGAPERVDWVDYQRRNAAADPAAFAASVLAAAPGRTVWLVSMGGYRTYSDSCDVLGERLRAARSAGAETVVRSRGRYKPERMALVRFAP
ncbi:MAG TPA: glycosyltransferase family 39 protein [Mycobacteriales bacterium]|nr:glycosyltransferase family 39 protein [Mycobacteriales bacterium]